MIWKSPLNAHTYKKHADNSYATSTPSVDADEIYVCWTTPEALQVAAFSHDGKKLWNQQLGEFISQHGGGQSPLVFGDVVLVSDLNEGPESFLFGLDRKTGQIRWKVRASDRINSVPSTPCIYQPTGSRRKRSF